MKVLSKSLFAAGAIALSSFLTSQTAAQASDVQSLSCSDIGGALQVGNEGFGIFLDVVLQTGEVITVTAGSANDGNVRVFSSAGDAALAANESTTIAAQTDGLVVAIEGGQGAVAALSCGQGVEQQVDAEQADSEDVEDVVVAPSTLDVQNAFSSRMMMSHLGSLYDDVHRNTAGVLNGTGNQSVSQNDLFLQSVGKAAKDVPGSQPTLNVFVAADVTSFDGDSFDGLTGNLTLGMDYRINRDVVVGALVSGGRADFSTLIGTNVGSLESTGYTLGLYGAAKVFGDVTVDGILTYSGLDYDVANGGTTGDFNANRFGISVGVYNQMPFMGAILEPHARVIYGVEEQDGYTDSVGRAVASQSVNAGRVVLGPRLIAPMANGFTPWISASGVYEFSDSGNLATGAPDFDDTFSGTVGLGFDWSSDLGQIGGKLEFGGLGSGLYHSISGTVQYSLEF